MQFHRIVFSRSFINELRLKLELSERSLFDESRDLSDEARSNFQFCFFLDSFFVTWARAIYFKSNESSMQIALLLSTVFPDVFLYLFSN